MSSILIVEDDPSIAQGVSLALRAEHFSVMIAETGNAGFRRAKEESPDLIILDLVLPDLNGEDVCRRLRAAAVGIPILILSSKREEMDKVVGLEIGADDYLTKPFSTRELIARVRALLRRTHGRVGDLEDFSLGDVRLNFKQLEAFRGKKSLKLSAREFSILKLMALHIGEVVTRDELLEKVWGYEQFPTTRTVDNYILSIRKKIESDPTTPRHLLTIHTAGYKLTR